MSSNGRTTVSGTVNWGSSPCIPATTCARVCQGSRTEFIVLGVGSSRENPANSCGVLTLGERRDVRDLYS